jgi:hypothetical protein
VCFEEIRITAEASPVDVGAWAPLLIRDIPVYAWLPGLPTPARLAPVLEAAEYIDTLIADSSRAATPEEALEALRGLRRARAAARRSIAVSDLAWSRTLPLRMQAARSFDPPDQRARLSSIREVAAGTLAPSEALGLFLWLASRLGWKRRAGAQTAGLPPFTDATGEPVTLTARAGSGRAPGEPLSARIRFDDGDDLLLGAAGPTDGEILLAEVDSLRQDPLLDDALAAAGEPT